MPIPKPAPACCFEVGGGSGQRAEPVHEACRIVWRTVPTGWLKRASKIRIPGQMPYLVGEREIDWRSSLPEEGITRDSYRLCCGILFSMFDQDKYRWDQSRHGELKGFLMAAMEDLWELERFGPFDPEEQVLFYADMVERKYGPVTATRLLAAGHVLLPESAEIHARLLIALWETFGQIPEAEQGSVLRFLVNLYSGTRFDGLDQEIQEQLVLNQLKVLVKLGRTKEQNRFFWSVASKQIRDPGRKAEMRQLMQTLCSAGNSGSDHAVAPTPLA